MTLRLTRRRLAAFGFSAIAAATVGGRAQEPARGWSLPIRQTGRLPGDDFMISRRYACENLERYPGWWHTAEDRRLAGDLESAGSEVLAVTGGVVVYADYEYPGRVVIVEHADLGFYTVYGHLDYALDVAVGVRVVAGQPIGRLLRWSGGAPSHLHFEVREFYIDPIVNGNRPSHGVHCGFQCPPGPGYWPMQNGRHPAELGWLHPTHVIGHGLAAIPVSEVQVAATGDGLELALREALDPNSSELRTVALRAGERFPVLGVDTGDPAPVETSALAYRLRYRLALPSGESDWVDAVLPDDRKVGSDGHPASIRLVLLPVPTDA